MTTASHYQEAEHVLSWAQAGVTENLHDLAKGQLHALMAVADDLRAIRNELTTIRELLAQRDA
jgi:hypothetical protein